MIKLFDKDLNLVAILENAFNIGYSKKLNNLWTAKFSLPANDPKTAECTAYRYVEIFDNNERVDLFRIIPSKLSKNDITTITYECEHVLDTLMDDILFQYHQLDNQNTSTVLQYILNQQTIQRWQLGTVDYNYMFSYKWENENLLGSLFSVTKPFLDEYMWTWDTNSYPWTLNLVNMSNEVQSYIRYGKNLVGIEKEEDPTNLVTRLYALGYGEGVNQLTIESVNGGLPYIDADTIGTYGIITNLYVDKSEENPATLKAKAQSYLDELKISRISYTVSAADLYQITNDSIDKFDVGTNVKVYDIEDNIEFTARVVTVEKDNITENPGDVKLEIANKPQDIAQSMSDLRNRQYINEVYAQGATQLYPAAYEDNADPDNPAIIKIFIPDETVRINKMLLTYECSEFRAYSKATKSNVVTEVTSTVDDTPEIWFGDPPTVGGDMEMSFGGSHNHDGSTGVTGGADFSSHSHSISSDGSHVHHLYRHKHPHNHIIEVPSHTHDIDYGIYLGDSPSSVTIKVDGNTIPISSTSANNVDIIPYLSKDAEGKINRGTWHTISITPNSLGRITANIIGQLFVQSRGGGSY